jgi:single-stranded DNA-binding protein
MSGIETAFFGALGRDAERKTSAAGKPFLRLNVRVGDGDAVQWINVTTFDANAIEAAEKLVKGSRVYVEGRLSLDEWTAKDGSKRQSLSCMSWHTRLSKIGRNRREKSTSDRESASHPYAPTSGAPFNDDVPFLMEWRG